MRDGFRVSVASKHHYWVGALRSGIASDTAATIASGNYFFLLGALDLFVLPLLVFLLLLFFADPAVLLALDFPLLSALVALRVGNFLRLVFATSRSCFSLMDSYIPLEAPLRAAFGRAPRLADKAAPAAFCCFLDFAGMQKGSLQMAD